MNKQTTVRAVAKKTGYTYFEVQTILEAIIAVWSDELANRGQIVLQDFLTIKVTEMKTHQRGKLKHHGPNTPMRKVAYRVDARLSEALRKRLHSIKLRK